MVRVKFFNSAICFCLTLGLAVLSAQAQDTHKENTRSLNHYILGVYCQGLGDLEGALGEYQKALKADPESSLLHLNLASVFIQKENLDLAIAELKHSIRLAPEAVQPHTLLALVYIAQNKADLAATEYILALENATKAEPNNIETYKGLGAIYLQQNKLKQAEGIFKLIVKMAPADAEAHFYLGSVYYSLEDSLTAEKELTSAVKLKPDYHEALNFLGYFYLEHDKNIDQAGSMIKQALVFEPENGAYLDSLGWFYYKKGKFKEALSHLERAAYFLSDPVIYDHLGDAFLKLGNTASAKLNWEKSLKLDSQNAQVKAKLLKFTNHGQ
ncbi:MAG: tetratricopeptide repeat protein [Candidatus Omnitrophota bacterium]